VRHRDPLPGPAQTGLRPGCPTRRGEVGNAPYPPGRRACANAQLAGANAQLAGANAQLAGANAQLAGANAQLAGANAQLATRTARV
jgi:hypothetical protein